MTNSKTTKRALFSSVMALLLCFTMLLGTTFAWFTDTAASGRNTIQSGNLDVVLEYKTNWEDNWTPVTESTKLFKEGALYEPGYTEVVFLRVSNAGSLALKYDLKVNIYGETKSTNVDNEQFSLKDYLEIGYYVQDEYSSGANYADILMPTMFGTREAALTSVTTTKISADTGIINANAPVLAGTETAQVVAIVLTMPTNVGNEANHKTGVDAPTIDLGVTLLATQYTYENDSFDNQYDKDAEYPVTYDHTVGTTDELEAAFANGGTIQLTNDIALDERLTVAEGKEVYLDMNGKEITVSTTDADPAFYTYKDSTLTITGNGKVTLKDPSLSLLFPGGDVVIENGTFIREVPAGTPANQVGALIVGAKVSPWGSQTITINGGYFDGGYYDENAADIDEILAGTKTLTETTDDIANRGNSKDTNAVRVAVKKNTQLTLNLSDNLMKVYGGTFVGVNPAWGDEGCMLPTTPNYLRPWSYYQGALLDGQTFNENGIVLPDGYTITKEIPEDGRPTYTVNYTK